MSNHLKTAAFRVGFQKYLRFVERVVRTELFVWKLHLRPIHVHYMASLSRCENVAVMKVYVI